MKNRFSKNSEPAKKPKPKIHIRKRGKSEVGE